MKKPLFLLSFILLVGLSWAQRHSLDTYSVTLNKKRIATTANFQEVQKKLSAGYNGKSPTRDRHFILQFNTLPTLEEQKQLKAQGITLLNYLNGNAYFVSVSSSFYSMPTSASKNIRSLIDIMPEYKIREDLASGNTPEYAKGKGNLVKVVVTYFKYVDAANVNAVISELKIANVKMLRKFNQFTADVTNADINKLAALDWVQNIEPIAPPTVLDNDHGKNLHRANVLNSTIPGLGYGLTGKDVKIGLWDADAENHQDFNGRLVNREYEIHTSDHGTHTAGTIAGAGLIDPKARGMAPEAQIYAWNFNTQSNGLSVPDERVLALDNDGIELTSNSWGYNITTCPNPVSYNSIDHNEDLIASWYPYFLYVFSAGNNQSVCSNGYFTTTKNMKNSIVVAAIDQKDIMSSFSSFGPSFDGRLIPNISGDGVDVYSTEFDNGYGLMSGTSMATPGVAGTMALIYQRYKDTHGGQKPSAAFLRGLACNTARDLGTPGPDYKYGYGEINGLRAVEVMEQNNYFINEVSQGTTYKKTITVPTGAVALNVMLSWTDPAGTVGSAKILVNDLDLSVSDGSTTVRPWVLNPENPAATAVRDYDGLNNLEQVTLSNPATGTYIITVDGYEIPEGIQEFAVVYDIVMPDLKLTYPIGGEYLTPGTQEVIRWDCEGYTKPFILEYSIDGGANYSVIAGNIPANTRSYLWTVPTETTNNAKFRISNGTMLDVDKSSFSIMQVPQNVKIKQVQCGGAGPYTIQWDAVANARYEILKLNGQVYEHLADVSTNSFTIQDIEQNNNNCYCVRAISLTTRATSQRSLAVTITLTVSITDLPFNEKFDSQKASNFNLTSTYGQANIRYVNDTEKYGIRLEGTSGETTDWVPGTEAACFTSNPNYITKATICSIDATSLAGKTFILKFDYRLKYRKAPGTSFFRVKVNGNYLTNTTGTQIYGSFNQLSYKSVYYDLAAYAGLSSVTVEFEAVCKTNYTTYVNESGSYDFSSDTYDAGDFVAIDNLELREDGEDIALTTLTLGTGNTNAETIAVTVKNLSNISVSSVPVFYTINGETAINEIVPGPITPLAEVTYVFNSKADFSVVGVYAVSASVNLQNDPIPANNTLSETITNNGNDIVIGIDAVTTCSAVLVDQGGRYGDYVENQDRDIILKPGIIGKNIKITFSEFATEDMFDYVYVFSGTTATAANLLGKFSGNTLPPSITSYALGGELYVRFISDGAVNGKGFVATVECIDKVTITDAALTAITEPTTSSIKTATETVTVLVSNPGSPDLTGAVVYYQLGTNPPVQEKVATIVSGAVAKSYSFATKVDLSVPGTYTLKAWIAVPGDALTENNSVTTTITSVAAPVPTLDAGISAAGILPARTKLSTIEVTVENFGNISIVNPTLAYKINGGTEVTQTFIGTIAESETASYSFDSKADLRSLNTTYNIDVYTKVSGDANTSNDLMSVTVETPDNSVTNVVGTYDAIDDNVIAPASDAVSLTNNYTVECWVNLQDVSAYGRIFDKSKIFLFYETNYGVNFYGTNALILSLSTSQGSSTLFVPDVVKPGQWQHLAVTCSGDNVYTLYVDGVAQTLQWYSGSSTPGVTNDNSTNPFYIGCGTTASRIINGNLDEFRVWNSALSQDDIQSNMMTDYPVNTAGLLAYYKFIEGNGSYVYDYSSNDNTALITGADVTGLGEGKFWNAQPALLTNLSFAGEVAPTTFDAATNTFTTAMPVGTDLTNLSANFSIAENSIVTIGTTPQVSGVTTNDYTNIVAYTVKGIGFNSGIVQTIYAKVATDLSSECDLTSFSFEIENNPGLSGRISLVRNGNNFYKKVAYGTGVSSLRASFSVSAGARLYINGIEHSNPQAEGVNYSESMIVTVQSANGRFLKYYSISVDDRNTLADLIAFNIPDGQVGTTTINPVDHTVTVWVKKNTNLSMLNANFVVSPQAKVYINSITQLNGITTNDLTNPIVYKVVSESESKSSDWKVTVVRDEIKPIITLNGITPMSVTYGSDFNDPGLTVLDNIDNDLASRVIVEGSVNTSAVGSYILTYKVQDAAGNMADEVTRTVNVVKATATVVISDLIQYFDGTPRAVSVTTDPIGVPVIVTYNGSATVPTNVGTYAVVATINDPNYIGEQSASFEIMPYTGMDQDPESPVMIYSDGTSIYLNINKVTNSSYLLVYDVIGNSVYQRSALTEGLTKIDRNFISGVYLVKLEIDGKRFSKRVVIL